MPSPAETRTKLTVSAVVYAAVILWCLLLQCRAIKGWRWLPDNVFPKVAGCRDRSAGCDGVPVLNFPMLPQVEWVEGQPAANIPRLPFGGSYSGLVSLCLPLFASRGSS